MNLVELEFTAIVPLIGYGPIGFFQYQIANHETVYRTQLLHHRVEIETAGIDVNEHHFG